MLSYFQPITLAALRVFAAFMFWQYAGQRLFGMFGGEQAAIFSPVWFVGLVEFVGSIAMGIGFLTRPVAVILTAELLLFYLFHYLPQGFPPYGSRLGEHIVALLFVSGFLAFAGPGRFSVDGDLKAQRSHVDVPWFADGLEPYYPRALGVFRILVALLYAQHGLPKLGIGGEAAAFLTQRWVAGVVELFGGAAIALGLLTRPVAFLASGQMAFAYFLSHAPRSFFPIENGGDRAAMFCFFFLCLVPAGPGAWAVDRWRRTRPPGDKVRVAAET